MIICQNCGVELEPDMEFCPLCQQPATEKSDAGEINPALEHMQRRGMHEPVREKMIFPLRKAAWELISVILILIIVITSLLNIILNKEISWSEYPVAFCLIMFSYITLSALTGNRKIIRFLWVFMAASALIFALDTLTDSPPWALTIGIPLLFLFNFLLAILLIIIRRSKKRGFNLIAYTLAAAALFCIGIEAITDLFSNGFVSLVWSMIISACILPIVILLLFIHFRLGGGSNLNKIFHI